MRARSRDDLVLAYRAAILLRLLTGWGWRKTWKTLRELGFEVSPNIIRCWFYYGNKPYFRPSVFEKSLFYHVAYDLVLEVAAEHPEWGPKKLASYVSNLLPIRIPPLTVYYWVKGLSRPNITPIRPCQALGYLAGVLAGDYGRNSKGLRVKDREFAEYYAEMYEEVTGVRPRVYSTKDGYYYTRENAAWLKELWHSGLWKIVAYAYPIEFLKGLYDSEGCISIKINNMKLKSVIISLITGDEEVKELAKRILGDLGLEPKERYRPGNVRRINGRVCAFTGSWELYFCGWDKLERFAKLISFREGKKRRRLELLLSIKHLPPRQRYRIRTKYYVKENGRWVERAPEPPPLYLTIQLE